MYLPILRADFTLVETYAYADEAPLDCPITAFGGRLEPPGEPGRVGRVAPADPRRVHGPPVSGRPLLPARRPRRVGSGDRREPAAAAAPARRSGLALTFPVPVKDYAILPA